MQTVYVGVFQHWDDFHTVAVASSAKLAKRACERFTPPDRPDGYPMPEAFQWETYNDLHWFADFGEGEFQGMGFRIFPMGVLDE